LGSVKASGGREGSEDTIPEDVTAGGDVLLQAILEKASE